MKLIDTTGKEITSKENKQANELEKQLEKNVEKLLEPVFNKIKLSGAQVPQQQLLQLASTAHQMLFNRMIFNLLIRSGVNELTDVLSEVDVEELQTNLSNQLQFVDRSELEKQMKGPSSE